MAAPVAAAARGAGLLGALAFGDEFRHPALAADRGTVPLRLGLLTAELLVASGAALVPAVLTVGCDAELLHLVHGPEVVEVPADWFPLGAGRLGPAVGCACAGVLAAGVFRSATAGLAVVVAVPLLAVPSCTRWRKDHRRAPRPGSRRGCGKTVAPVAFRGRAPSGDGAAGGRPTRGRCAGVVAGGAALRLSAHDPAEQGSMTAARARIDASVATTPREKSVSFR
ncbi:ABC transporter [Streptomyces viridosporus ATCC 14672]|uniref:ABC transporter n=1 Tax=Streptomyces viridosporus (strain ATCC 14672 / DSM 40746 / JCM 4963 / KCTC 9882 / NRRL B-12104 / FH 1290) TaxID=566461 RepID=D5ZSY1_STRV1|nr:ABC transporter [Streptomyces viridosporus ATCC 14672]